MTVANLSSDDMARVFDSLRRSTLMDAGWIERHAAEMPPILHEYLQNRRRAALIIAREIEKVTGLPNTRKKRRKLRLRSRARP